MRPVSETGKAIKILVDDYNANKENNLFPVLALQFVSLDNIREGKMIWWNYLHHSVAEQYLKAIKEFTGKDEDSQEIKRTLINWEYDGAAFWYRDLGENPILGETGVLSGNEFLEVTVDIDRSKVERLCADSTEKDDLLNIVWLDALKNNFNCKGSTMWVSLPHKDMSGDTIYSSVFCVFNSSVAKPVDQLRTARLFRNFIVDYIIDRYKEPLQSELDAIKAAVNVQDFRPESFNYHGAGRASDVKKICEHYFQNHHLASFEKEREKAHDRFLKAYLGSLTVVPVLDYKPLHKLRVSSKQEFFKIIFARMLFLAYFVVYEYTLELSFRKVAGKDVGPDYVLNILGIDGLQKDRPDGSGKPARKYEAEKIIPFISTAEFRFLLTTCDMLSKSSYFKAEIIEARPAHLR